MRVYGNTVICCSTQNKNEQYFYIENFIRKLNQKAQTIDVQYEGYWIKEYDNYGTSNERTAYGIETTKSTININIPQYRLHKIRCYDIYPDIKGRFVNGNYELLDDDETFNGLEPDQQYSCTWNNYKKTDKVLSIYVYNDGWQATRWNERYKTMNSFRFEFMDLTLKYRNKFELKNTLMITPPNADKRSQMKILGQWYQKYVNKPYYYKNEIIHVKIEGFFGDLPEIFDMSDISWYQTCNNCYITNEQVLQYNAGICGEMRCEQERETLLSEMGNSKNGRNSIRTANGYKAPMTQCTLKEYNILIECLLHVCCDLSHSLKGLCLKLIECVLKYLNESCTLEVKERIKELCEQLGCGIPGVGEGISGPGNLSQTQSEKYFVSDII